MERLLAYSHGRLLIISFSWGVWDWSLDAWLGWLIPYSNSYTVFSLTVLQARSLWEKNLVFCIFADACIGVWKEMADRNSHIQTRQSKSTNKLCDTMPLPRTCSTWKAIYHGYFIAMGILGSKLVKRINEWLFCWWKTHSICGLLRESGAKNKMY